MVGERWSTSGEIHAGIVDEMGEGGDGRHDFGQIDVESEEE